MSDISAKILLLRKEAQQKLEEAHKLELVLDKFPDLRSYEGRWKKEVVYSEGANTKVTKYDSRHNCGCCEDSPLEIWPYMEYEGTRIYSDPPCFVVGEKESWTRDRPYEGWQDKLKEANIPNTIISTIEYHFTKNEEEIEDDIA